MTGLVILLKSDRPVISRRPRVTGLTRSYEVLSKLDGQAVGSFGPLGFFGHAEVAFQLITSAGHGDGPAGWGTQGHRRCQTVAVARFWTRGIRL